MHRMIFNVFSKIGNKIVIQLDLSSYTAKFINATQTAIIDQLIALKNNEFYLKQTKNCVQL